MEVESEGDLLAKVNPQNTVDGRNPAPPEIVKTL